LGAILQSPIENDRAITFEDVTVTTPSEKLRVFGQEDHVRIYGRDYNERLAKAGFVVREDDFIYTLTQNEKEKYLLDNNEVIYFCTKSNFPRN
jgi:hypothetical protein